MVWLPTCRPFLHPPSACLPSPPCLTTPCPCRGPSCTAPYWLYSAWSACNATCGGGAATRSATCEAPKGKDCDKVEQQPLEQECNTAACGVFAWQAGEWSSCSAECGGARGVAGCMLASRMAGCTRRLLSREMGSH